MKRNVLNLSVGLFVLCMFSSCLKDGEDVHVSYGVIRNVNSTNDYEILTDKGNTLKVTKSHTSHTIENDKRVLVNFEVLSDKDKNKMVYEVSVNGFYDLLSKPVVNESFILENEESRRDSIGNDPVNTIRAHFGGNYVNIDFELLFYQHSTVKHMINLVYDDTRADADTICLTLYHNAYGEVLGNQHSLITGSGKSSFKISDLLPAGVTSQPVKITWTEYGYNHEPRVRSISGTYKLNASSDIKIQMTRNFDSSLEIK